MSRRLKKRQWKTSTGSATGVKSPAASAIENTQEVQLAFPAGAVAVMEGSKGYDWKGIGICVVLAILVFAVFGQTLRHEFVNYDDGAYVYANSEVIKGLSPEGVASAFTSEVLCLWTPLVTVSHMVDCQLYGLKPGGHHLTNVALHMASAILLFLVFRQMTAALWRSAFVAALFAIHPLKVESVAWISERKDVLSGLLFMLTLGAYLRYVRRPGSVGRYLWVVILFAFGLMCKPMLVTLPFVLLLLDYWPLKRLFLEPLPACADATKWPLINWRAVAEKVPLLALSVAFCVFILMGGKKGVLDAQSISFWARIGEAPAWVVTYLWQMIWPMGLTPIYTHPEAGLPWWPAALALCGAISAGTFLFRKKHPYLWTGWLWNLGMLAPVSGIVQISRHARADHYNYLPQIGLCIGLTWAVADWAGERRNRRIGLGVLGTAVLCVLSSVAWHQTSYWRDNTTLWNHTLECTQDNACANFNLGIALDLQGRTEEAIAHYREALRSSPSYFECHDNLGEALLRQGRTEEAIAEFYQALQIYPAYEEAHYNLGNALIRQGRMEEAVAQYREALQINPTSFKAHSNLGEALFGQGWTGEAIAEYREALRINPAFPEGYFNLGNALLRQGQTEEAIAQYREALRINPAFLEAHCNFGNALLRLGRTEEAIAQYQEALRIRPTFLEAHNSLGNALLQQRRTDGAITQYREALLINPNSLEARNNLGEALLRQGRTEEAITQYREALRIDPTFASGHYNLGVSLFGQQRTEDAIVHVQKAFELQPSNVTFQNELALMLSTAPQISLRDGPKALRLATQASQSMRGNNPLILRTQSAAFAETGDFFSALQTARKALELAEAQSRTALSDKLRREIKLYETGRRFEDVR